MQRSASIQPRTSTPKYQYYKPTLVSFGCGFALRVGMDQETHRCDATQELLAGPCGRLRSRAHSRANDGFSGGAAANLKKSKFDSSSLSGCELKLRSVSLNFSFRISICNFMPLEMII